MGRTSYEQQTICFCKLDEILYQSFWGKKNLSIIYTIYIPVLYTVSQYATFWNRNSSVWVVGAVRAVRKKSGFEEFWATFEGGFFNFLWAKKFEKVVKNRQPLKFLFFPQKVEKPPSKVAQNSSNPLFSLTAQMAQTEEFMFKNVAYRPTV